MADEGKTEKLDLLLKLVLIELFSLRTRIDALSAILPESQRKTVFEVQRWLIEDHSEVLVNAFFSHLRGLAGEELPDESAINPSDMSSENLWSTLQQADDKEKKSSHFESEYRRLWDAL